ncbi:MAG: hypothetical protein LUQ05_03720 [Methanoregula sp.]|nr:hypothetical protein [Methanoregula sp.]
MPNPGISKPENPPREKNRRVQKNILELTLERLQKLYEDSPVRPGRLSRLAIKPHWNIVLGSNNECGLANNFLGIQATYADRAENTRFLNLIGKPLMELADWGIHAKDLQERSIGIAALSALSQRFLESLSIRNRGFLARCWIPTDKLVQQYPTISRLVTKNDIVVVVGYGNEVRNLRGRCRELHVTDMRLKDTFGTMIIDKGIVYGPKDIVVHSEKEREMVLGIADVVIISASTLVDNTFDEIVKFSTKAHLIGIYGPGGSLIPDVFFDRGIDFITSFRIADSVRFSEDMINDNDMEFAVRTSQKQYMFMRPLAKTSGTSIHKMLRQAKPVNIN